MLTINLPWPPVGLSPNARNHWTTTARLKKAYRKACAMAAMEHGARRLLSGRLEVHLRFIPPDRRARDWDNLLASMKAGLDGLADVLQVDDSRWRLSFDVAQGEVGGMVVVQIEEMGANG